MGDRSDSPSNYPPVGSPDRYDMIVQRGRALRRRRRYSLGAGAGGTVVAIALAVVFVTSGGDGGDDLNATEVAGVTSIATTTTTTTTLPPSVGDTTVDIDPATRTVTVTDLTLPVSDVSKQCVHLALRSPDGQLVAELDQCNYYEAPAVDVLTLDLLLAEGTEIGCSRKAEQPIAPPAGTTQFDSTFGYGVAAIPPGEYTLTVGASSGISDGCAYTADASVDLAEDVDFETITIEIP